MGYKSRSEYPRPERSAEIMVNKAEGYEKKGLTPKEADDLIVLESVEYNGAPLSEEEKERKKRYMEKMEKTENDKK